MASTGILYIHIEDCELDNYGNYILKKAPLPVKYDPHYSSYVMDVLKKIIFLGDFRNYTWSDDESKFIPGDPFSENGIVEILSFSSDTGYFRKESTDRTVSFSVSTDDNGMPYILIHFNEAE